jgi:hypothetical protein
VSKSILIGQVLPWSLRFLSRQVPWHGLSDYQEPVLTAPDFADETQITVGKEDTRSPESKASARRVRYPPVLVRYLIS